MGSGPGVPRQLLQTQWGQLTTVPFPGVPHWSSLVMSNAPVLSRRRQGCSPTTCPAAATYVARGHRRQEEGTLAPVAKRAALGERGPGQSDPGHARKSCSGSHTPGWLVGSWVWVWVP